MKKKKFFILAAVIFTVLVFISASASVDAAKMQEINALDLSVKSQDINPRGTVKPDLNFGKLPLHFIFNKGQVNKKARFYAKASRYTLWLTKEGLVFDSFKKVKVEVEEEKERHTLPFGHPSQEGSETGEYKIRPYKGFPGERRGEPCRLSQNPLSLLFIFVFLSLNYNINASSDLYILFNC